VLSDDSAIHWSNGHPTGNDCEGENSKWTHKTPIKLDISFCRHTSENTLFKHTQRTLQKQHCDSANTGLQQFWEGKQEQLEINRHNLRLDYIWTWAIGNT